MKRGKQGMLQICFCDIVMKGPSNANNNLSKLMSFLSMLIHQFFFQVEKYIQNKLT